jgi:DNA-directed RNA polymerase alpha subunit
MRENFLRYNISISYLNLTPRASNALKRNGIETIGQLVKVTISDVSNMKGVGKKVVDELISKLQAYDMLDADCNKIRLTKESFKKLTQESQ